MAAFSPTAAGATSPISQKSIASISSPNSASVACSPWTATSEYAPTAAAPVCNSPAITIPASSMYAVARKSVFAIDELWRSGPKFRYNMAPRIGSKMNVAWNKNSRNTKTPRASKIPATETKLMMIPPMMEPAPSAAAPPNPASRTLGPNAAP